jgi:hypothetical protein
VNVSRRAWIAALCGGLVALGAFADDAHRTVRADLLGAWRLVRIDVRGPQGAEPDPFYGTGSEGLLVYDPSGWFSVQIMSGPRPRLEVPAARPERPGGGAAVAKEAALDTYYAYYGSWSFDPATSTVTHHAFGALYPSEQGATYAQRVQVDGRRMTFTRSQGVPPHQTIQTKVWERIPESAVETP